MLDPFPFSPIPALTESIAPISERLHLKTLPFHVHEVFFAFFFYHIAQHVISPWVSRTLWPQIYSSLKYKTRVNWDVHVVSMIQSILICSMALWVILTDKEVAGEDWKGRIWGYSGAAGLVQALAGGYFAWDITVSAYWLDVLGIGSLLHAIAAFVITMLGFRPFANYYGLAFILYELSTPFLNIHWFCDKLGKTGSNLQLYNGIVLIVTFGLCRLVWGVYQSVHIYHDMWQAIRHHKTPLETGDKENILETISEIQRTAESEPLPMLLIVTYLVGNSLLILLNFYWFSKMIEAVAKRFRKPTDKKE